MSDISIPGLTSKYNSTEIVKGLVEAEKTRLTSMEEELDSIELEKKHWQEVNRRLSALQTSAKKLFGFENPFNEKVVTSSNEGILTATADRSADLSDYSLKVLQTAKSDRFLSGSLSDDYRVESGTYTYKVGDEEVSFRFRGGKLRDFASKVNEQGNNLIRATVVKDTADTQVLLLEAIPTGSFNRMFFKDDAEKLALSASMIRRQPVNMQQADTSAIKDLTPAGLEERLDLQDDTLTLRYGGKASIPLNRDFPIEEGTILEIEVEIQDLDENQVIPAEPQPPELPNIPGIEYEGISVESAGSLLDLPPWESPPPPERSDDLSVIAFSDGTSRFNAEPIEDRLGPQRIAIPLKTYLDQLDSVELTNNNTHRDIQFRNIRVYNPDQQRGYEAVNPVDSAEDALVEFNGIEISRETNEIDDLIPGVTLDLNRASDEEVDLSIEPDRELSKESLIEFVFQYNNVITRILILSQDNPDVVDEIEYFTDEERDQAMEDLGDLRADLTLMQIKNRLQSIVTSPYETRAGNALSLLTQLGISSNETGGGGFNAAKLRGYLEINEGKLDQALNGDILAIKELFGMDSDGDLLMDSGAGVQLDNYLKAFTQTGGILTLKTDRLDREIDEQNDDIDDFKTYLEDYEQELKIEYGNMEGMLNQLESSSKSLDNMFNSNNQ